MRYFIVVSQIVNGHHYLTENIFFFLSLFHFASSVALEYCFFSAVISRSFLPEICRIFPDLLSPRSSKTRRPLKTALRFCLRFRVVDCWFLVGDYQGMESPLIAILTSTGADQRVISRGFPSLAHLLSPFSTHTLDIRVSF